MKANATAGAKNNVYIIINIGGKMHKSHRLAWLAFYGAWPKDGIDHINHIRSDNRIINLREATLAENGKNRTLGKNNKSGVYGVSWDNERNKWVSNIKVNSKTIFLGRFDSFFNAVCARKSAEVKYGFHSNHGIRIS